MEVQVLDRVDHENIDYEFGVIPLTPVLLGPDYDDDDWEPSSPNSPPANFLIKFELVVYPTSYDVLSCVDIGTDNKTLIHQSLSLKRRAVICKLPEGTLMMNNGEDTNTYLSFVLSRHLGITRSPGDMLHDQIMDDIMKQIRRVSDEVFSPRREMLGVFVSIRKEHHMYRCDECLMGRVMRESADQSYNENMMVGASEESIRKVLKKVKVRKERKRRRSDDRVEEEEEEGKKRKRRKIRVSESDTCAVCMEEFEGLRGEYVAWMPCFHVFHGMCILKWLTQSHYCPLCRFEVPID